MVVSVALATAIRCHSSYELSVDVNRFDGGFDEAGSSKCGADRLSAVQQLHSAGACLEQEWRDHEEVLAAHERDLDICAPTQDTLEVSRGSHAAESAAKDDDTHAPSRIGRSYLLRLPSSSSYRNGLNAARSSDTKRAGSSHAAKCPPRSTWLK